MRDMMMTLWKEELRMRGNRLIIIITATQPHSQSHSDTDTHCLAVLILYSDINRKDSELPFCRPVQASLG